MSVFRFASISLVVFLLLAVFLKRIQNETQNPIILLAIDNSSSMTAGANSASVKTALLKNIDAFKEKIVEKFAVKTILFGEASSASQTQPTFTEKETDIENLLSDLDNNYSNQNTGALVLVSDGIYNRGANPVYTAEKLTYPIYTVAMGDTSELKDAAIQKINHNQVAYLGNNFPVEVIVQAKKYSGKELTVTLSRNGSEKAKQLVKINNDDATATCSFTLQAEQAGLVKYTVKLLTPDTEKNTSNNTQSFIMEVIDNREKILLLANAPHPDVAAIKDIITGSTAYELEYSLSTEFKKPVKPYSLVIIEGTAPNQALILNECRNNGVPFWIINSVENLPGLRITGSINRFNDAEPFVDPSFGLFTVSDELKKFMKDLPAVKTVFGNYTLNNNASALINQRIGLVETENPLFLFTEQNGLKAAVFAGDGLWKWKMRDFEEHGNHNLFQELVSKTIQYLSVKSDKSFFRITSPKIVNENEAVQLGAEVYNKSYEPVTEPDVTLELSNAERKTFNYTFSKTDNAYKLNIGSLPPGEYSYKAHVKYNNELFVKQGIIMVKEVVAEKINTVANHALLYQLANRSNGQLTYPGELDKLADLILKNETIKPITYSQTSTSLLIELKWLFGIILALMAVEWFFRKRFLSI